MLIGDESLPAVLIASVEAPCRTATPGQSISSGGPAVPPAPCCGVDGPKKNDFMRSVMPGEVSDCARASPTSHPGGPHSMSATKAARTGMEIVISSPSSATPHVIIAAQT